MGDQIMAMTLKTRWDLEIATQGSESGNPHGGRGDQKTNDPMELTPNQALQGKN